MTVREAPHPEPTYAVAELFPLQGQWSEARYLALETNRLIELSDGRLEVLPVPSYLHQKLLMRLVLALAPFVMRHLLGEMAFAPLRARLWPGKFREPDLMFVTTAHQNRIHPKHWDAPDLAVEIISDDDPDRDRIEKKAEYEQAGIPEYWIVDPETRTVEVYRLPTSAEVYPPAQMLTMADTLTSPLFPGWQLALAELFAE